MPPKKRAMSDQHKAALAEGRNESRAVAAYLRGLEENRPKRGRKRTPESIRAQLAKIESQLKGADPLKSLNLRQQRIDLQRELAKVSTAVDLSGLEAGFVKAAKGYSRRKGISYAVWRDQGVAADVLKKAGITRSGS